MATTQGSQEVINHHAQALGAEDEDGIDTFVFRDGLIWIQTASATAAARSLTGGKCCHAPGC
jgi:hypothetical protein